MASVLAKGAVAANLLLSVPLVLKHVGPELFGFWVTLGALISFLWLADLGVGNALVNSISERIGKGELRKVNQIISSALWLTVSSALFLTTCLLLARCYVDISSALGISANIDGEDVTTAILVIIPIIFSS